MVKKKNKNLPAVITDRQALSTISPLQQYLYEINRYPLLEPEEEYEIAVKHFETGDVASAHRLVTSNLRLVVKIANDFRQSQISLLDLIQEGNYGLMQAVKRFNPYKNVKLSSYAAWWIKAYILKYIIDNKSNVKLGTTAAQRKLFFNLKKEVNKLLSEYETASPKLIAANLNVTEKDVVEMQQRLSSPDISLDAPLGLDEKSGPIKASQIASPEESIEDVLSKRQFMSLFKDHLEEFKKTLQGKDLEIFNQRLVSETPLSLQELGDKYGISRERIRQIEARVIKKLKQFLVEKNLIESDKPLDSMVLDITPSN